MVSIICSTEVEISPYFNANGMRIGTVNLLKPSPVEMGHPKSIIQALAFRLWIWALNDINRV